MVSNTPHRGDIVHLDFDPSSGTFCPKNGLVSGHCLQIIKKKLLNIWKVAHNVCSHSES
jgi:hypothetical protein